MKTITLIKAMANKKKEKKILKRIKSYFVDENFQRI